MNLIRLNIVLLLIFITLNGQEKYLVYFKDKGISPSHRIEKSSGVYAGALAELSGRALTRRSLSMNLDSLISYEDLPLRSEYLAGLEREGIVIINKLKWFNAVSAYLDNDQKSSVESLDFVDRIETVKKVSVRRKKEVNNSGRRQFKTAQADSHRIDYGLSYTQLATSDIPTLHDLEIIGEGIVIGILDTGFDWKNHPSLNNATVIAEYDFIQGDTVTSNEDGDAPDQDDHGTYVFSIIGGWDEGKMIGAAYGAKYILAKTEDVKSETHIEEDNFAAALEWMEGLGVDVTNSSIGYNEFDGTTYSYTYSQMNGRSTIVAKAAEMAFQRGVVTVTSAGNEGNNSWSHIISPADAFNIISVGSVNPDNKINSYSSRGPTSDGRIKPEIVTQGSSVFGADRFTGGYVFSGGTSAASPIAAGITALLMSEYPHLTNRQVRNIILESGDQSSSPDNIKGYGLLSALRAIEYPNIQEIEDTLRLNKFFAQYDSIDAGSLTINYRINDEEKIYQGIFNQPDSVKYFYDFIGLKEEDSVFFSMHYTNKGTAVTLPVTGHFMFVKGDKNIYLNTVPEDQPVNPFDLILYQNYPNPFNSYTNIKFNLPEAAFVKISMYNILGERVAILLSKEYNKGTFQEMFYLDNFASGVYLYKIDAGGKYQIKKMMLIK